MKHITLAALFSVILIGVTGALSVEPTSRHEAIVRTLSQRLPREHLSRHNLDNTISQRTLTNYIASLDYDRVYFRASDIETFKCNRNQLDEAFRNGETTFAFKVFKRYKERVRNRVEYVKTLLDNGFDLTRNEKYQWKRKAAPWCETEAEWNDIWRKRIKNEYIRRMLADEIEDVKPDNMPPGTNVTAAVSTNVTAATTNDVIAPNLDLTPAEFIIDRYEQFLTTLEDSDNEWVMQKYLSAFARAYDPHCDYMSPATTENFDIEMKLSLFGIGALLRPEDGAAKIVRLIPGGPAARDESKNRLRPGDKIIAVAQDEEKSVSIMHWPLYKSVRLIRGPKGTRVVLTVIPATDPSGTTTKAVALVRDKVKLEGREVKSSMKTLPAPETNAAYNLGIIRIPAFYADLKGKRTNPDYKSSSRDVSQLLRDMRESDVDGILLDLRNNGGGSLLEAVLMTGLFIKTGPTVQVRERHTISILPDNDPTVTYGGPLVVLVNRLSASASEILAAALQDYGRAVIVGDSKTHGKGSVQTILNLNKNDKLGSLKVTNALFYRISGGSTQLRGVTPDIVIPSAFEFMDFGEDSLPNPMEWSTVQSTIYSPFAELDPTIELLRVRSRKRRRKDDQYAAYRQLLERIKTMNTRETLSLNIDQRREQSKAEQELLDIQNVLLTQSETEKEDDDENESQYDAVEGEALHVLSDLIYATTRHEKSIARTGSPPPSSAESHATPWTE